MGDQHVCSFCGEAQQGKPHIKLVFENWPVEQVETYRKRERRRTVTKEVITAVGLECVHDPERWADFPIEAGEVEAFFEMLRIEGKNPTFLGELTPDKTLICRAETCAQRQPVGEDPLACAHIQRSGYPGTGLDQLNCWSGHPGVVLVRQEKREPAGFLKSGISLFGGALAYMRLFFRGQGTSRRQMLAYYACWGLPVLVIAVWWCFLCVAWSPYYLKRWIRPI